jgi:phosphoribosylanthranilate isomerase
MVKVKICGITNLEDARNAVLAGADALGFVFYRKSPRYVSVHKAAQIIRELPKRVKKVGVFVNARVSTIKHCAHICGFDMVQLHGRESARTCSRLAPLPVIKAFSVRGAIDWAFIARYRTFAHLFDAYAPGVHGGTGAVFDWLLLRDSSAKRASGVLFLSGGLHGRNVRKAICVCKPQWVDASSSLESFPGKKDTRKMVAFVKAAKHTLIVS